MANPGLVGKGEDLGYSRGRRRLWILASQGTMPSPRVRAPRYDVKLEAVCDTGLGVFSGLIIDMSESGVFLVTEQSLRPGTMVSLIPNVPEDVQLPAEIKAQVIRVRELAGGAQLTSTQGIAFRLVGMTMTQFSQVRGYLAKYGRRKIDPSQKKSKPKAP
jgi:hypothetical protein